MFNKKNLKKITALTVILFSITVANANPDYICTAKIQNPSCTLTQEEKNKCITEGTWINGQTVCKSGKLLSSFKFSWHRTKCDAKTDLATQGGHKTSSIYKILQGNLEDSGYCAGAACEQNYAQNLRKSLNDILKNYDQNSYKDLNVTSITRETGNNMGVDGKTRSSGRSGYYGGVEAISEEKCIITLTDKNNPTAIVDYEFIEN